MNPQTRKVAANEWCKHNQFEASASLFTAFLAGTEWQNKQLLDVVGELRSIILSQPRYSEKSKMVTERQSFKTAMNRLAKVDAMMKKNLK